MKNVICLNVDFTEKVITENFHILRGFKKTVFPPDMITVQILLIFEIQMFLNITEEFSIPKYCETFLKLTCTIAALPMNDNVIKLHFCHAKINASFGIQPPAPLIQERLQRLSG